MTEAEVSCQICGRRADAAVDGDPPLTWVLDRQGEHTRWTCPRCAAEHLRAMEAKLEPEWW
jgi:transcription elongation factor Elf1